MSKINYQSTFKPDKEKTLAQLANKMDLAIKLPCDGKKKCGKCQIRIISGDVNKATKEEEKLLKKKDLDDGVRLACCVIPKGDVTFTKNE